MSNPPTREELLGMFGETYLDGVKKRSDAIFEAVRNAFRSSNKALTFCWQPRPPVDWITDSGVIQQFQIWFPPSEFDIKSRECYQRDDLTISLTGVGYNNTPDVVFITELPVNDTDEGS